MIKSGVRILDMCPLFQSEQLYNAIKFYNIFNSQKGLVTAGAVWHRMSI